MPEWLAATDNIAIIVLAIGCVGLSYYVRTLHNDNKELQKEARNALLEGISLEKDRAAELMSMQSVLSSIQRAIAVLAKQVTDGMERQHKEHRAIYGRLKHNDRN